MTDNYKFIEAAYKFQEYSSGNLLIIGIGGGSDIVGAYGLGNFLKGINPNVIIRIAVAVTPKSD